MSYECDRSGVDLGVLKQRGTILEEKNLKTEIGRG